MSKLQTYWTQHSVPEADVSVKRHVPHKKVVHFGRLRTNSETTVYKPIPVDAQWQDILLLLWTGMITHMFGTQHDKV
jgi:hypothetical protein